MSEARANFMEVVVRIDETNMNKITDPNEKWYCEINSDKPVPEYIINYFKRVWNRRQVKVRRKTRHRNRFLNNRR